MSYKGIVMMLSVVVVILASLYRGIEAHINKNSYNSEDLHSFIYCKDASKAVGFDITLQHRRLELV